MMCSLSPESWLRHCQVLHFRSTDTVLEGIQTKLCQVFLQVAIRILTNANRFQCILLIHKIRKLENNLKSSLSYFIEIL